MTSKANKKVNIRKLYSSEEGLLIVISAPSGSGKTTVLNNLIKQMSRIKHSISYTTREKRAGETEGKHYHFISAKTFYELRKKEVFLEWAKVYGNYYGTSREETKKFIKKGYDLIMDIDTKGAGTVKKLFKNAVLIFLLPPSLEELKKRLENRRSDSREEIKKRISMAMHEISEIAKYDYIVINDSLPNAVSAIKSIIQAEKKKVSRILR